MRSAVELGYPRYLGVPTIKFVHDSEYDYVIFDHLSACDYFNPKMLKVDHYELYAVLDNGEKVEIEVKDQRSISFKEDLVQYSISKYFPDEGKKYLEWIETLIPVETNDGKISNRVSDRFLILVRNIPELKDKSPFMGSMGDGFWCSRWPNEQEVKSMLRHLRYYEICLCQ